MRFLYQALKSTQILGQKRSSNHLEWIDAEKKRNNCLHVYLTFQPEGVKFLLELLHFLPYDLSTKVCPHHQFPPTPSSSFVMPCLHLPADRSVQILLLLLNNHDCS